MKIDKRIILIIILAVIIIILLLIRIFSPNNKSGTTNVKPNPSETNSQVNYPSSNRPKISVVSTNLANEPRGVAEPIIIKMDKPFLLTDVQAESEPKVELKMRQNFQTNELIIEPREIFDYGASYNLRLFSQSEVLIKEYNFSFKTLPYSGI